MIVTWWVLFSTPGRAEPGWREASPSPVTEIELQWMARELAPAVEEAAGRPFVELPEIVLAGPEQIAEVVYQEQRALLEQRGEVVAEADTRENAAAVSALFAGKYGFVDRKLYVSVEGIADSIALEGQPEWLLRPVIRVVVAHELAHALQDQHLDLQRRVADAPNGDAIMALNCAVEGHAVWVHEQVGKREGLDEAVRLMADLLGSDDALRRRMDPDAFYHTYVYGLGRDFVAYHAKRGGTERVWEVLAAPPDATRAIVSPEAWGADPSAPLDPRARRVIRRAGLRLAGKDWQPEDSVVGDFDVRDQLVRAGADDGLADALDSGWNTRLVGGAMAGVEVQVLRFTTGDAAVAFVDGMLGQARTQAALVGADPFIQADAGEFDRVESDRSAREAFTMSMFGPSEQLGRVWVARGTDVVQVVLVNAPASDRELAATIDQVFRSLR
ncbi:MAG: hypothetical protein ABMA64_32565 [Myxococcota bacterium]